MVNFGKFSSKNTVIFEVRQNMSPGVLIKSGVLITQIRYTYSLNLKLGYYEKNLAILKLAIEITQQSKYL